LSPELVRTRVRQPVLHVLSVLVYQLNYRYLLFYLHITILFCLEPELTFKLYLVHQIYLLLKTSEHIENVQQLYYSFPVRQQIQFQLRLVKSIEDRRDIAIVYILIFKILHLLLSNILYLFKLISEYFIDHFMKNTVIKLLIKQCPLFIVGLLIITQITQILQPIASDQLDLRTFIQKFLNRLLNYQVLPLVLLKVLILKLFQNIVHQIILEIFILLLKLVDKHDLYILQILSIIVDIDILVDLKHITFPLQLQL